MPAARRAYKGLGMEGFVARWYAKTTQKSMDEYRAAARLVDGEAPEGGRVLDLAPGPGYLAIELARLGRHRVAGLDVSETFVRIATENAVRAGVPVEFRLGNAAVMPFGDGTFDFVVCRAAFKNFADPVGALNETHRVLKPDGRALILDLRKDAPISDIDEHVRRMGLGRVNRFVTRLIFRHMLLKHAYSKADFERFVVATKFSHCELREEAIGLQVWLAK